MNLRARLAAVATLLLAVVVAGGWAIVHAVPRAQQAQVDRQLASMVPPAVDLFLRDAPIPPQPLDRPFADVDVSLVRADGSRAAIVAPSASGTAPAPEPAAPTVLSRPGNVHVRTVASVAAGPRWRAVLLQAPNDANGLLVAVSLDRADATARQVRLTVWAVGTILALAVAFGGWWILHLGLRPIAEVTAVADAITSGDRSRRVEVTDRRTEADHLGRAFNVMLDEHQADEARLRRFVSDASHELRTPVAAIRGFADLYRNGNLDEPGALADAMRRIGGESARMAGLVDDLVLLARLDEGRPLDQVRVDLSTILRDAALDASATHPSRTVGTDVADDLAVVGDDARLRQVFANLVHNALVHAGANATVVVRGHLDGALCIVEVADDGIGLDGAHAALAFDRFWRADPARQRNATGSGLGLPIVRAIVEASGGHVTLASQPGHGTTVRVVLPAA